MCYITTLQQLKNSTPYRTFIIISLQSAHAFLDVSRDVFEKQQITCCRSLPFVTAYHHRRATQ